jgi:PPE-repeat protein
VRKRRTQQAHKHDYADATMDYGVDRDWGVPPPDGPVSSTAASGSGAGSLGFAGTVSDAGEQATGLTTLPHDEFGSGPSMPMLPHTWPAEEGRDIP